VVINGFNIKALFAMNSYHFKVNYINRFILKYKIAKAILYEAALPR